MLTPAETPPPQRELECPKCFTVAVNLDFCVCGEYLAWDVTELPAEAVVSAYRPPTPADARPSTLVTLRDPLREDDPGAVVPLRVPPGMVVTLLATVRNQGEIVDAFDLRVDGVPEAWWTISPSTVFLNPWGTSGAYEQEVQIQLHPPRASEAEAREWPLTVVARSRSLGADVAGAQAALTILPFQDTVRQVGPERRRGRRRANFEVLIANRGNCPAEIAIDAEDTAARCPVAVSATRTTVPIGETVAAVVQVRVPFPLIFARPVDHRIAISHRTGGVESALEPSRVTFQQRPWLSWWLPPAVAVVAAFITLVLLLHRDTVAPDLAGRDVANAATLLKHDHLRIGHTSYAPAPKGVLPYTIIHQVPDAGAQLARKSVDITLAAPPKTGLVPSVSGRTLLEATRALDDAKFANSPQPSSAGDDWIVIRQDPMPGSTRDLGSPVTLAVESPTPSPTPTPTPTASPTPTATPKPRATATAGATAAAKPKATSAAAVKAKVASVPALPADLLFARGGAVYRWASAAARPVRLAAGLSMPAALDDGYAAIDDAGALVRVSADGKRTEVLVEGDYSLPVYSSRRGLLAVIGSGRLCVLDPQDASSLTCAAAPVGLDRPAWSPDGRSLLAVADDQLYAFTALGSDATQWAAPTPVHAAAGLRAAAWLANNRVAVLAGARPHVRLLARRADGSFDRVRDFKALTGSELAAAGRHLALRSDKTLTLIDVDRAQPRVRDLGTGVNPAWAN